MSTRIMSACWPLQMPMVAKAVLISMADQANDSGHCWPSVAGLAERTCCSERAVRNAIRWLEQAKAIVTTAKSGRTNSYIVTSATFTQALDAAPERRAAPAPRSKIPPSTPAPRAGTPAPRAPEPSITVKAKATVKIGARVPRFTPPIETEVADYCRERGKGVDPERWFAHYTSNGWRVGKNPMRDWRAAVRTWERNDLNPDNHHENRISSRNPSAVERVTAAIRKRREAGAETDPELAFG